MTELDYSRYATWELEAMKKARSMLSALNTPRENEELHAIKQELRRRKKNELAKAVKK